MKQRKIMKRIQKKIRTIKRKINKIIKRKKDKRG